MRIQVFALVLFGLCMWGVVFLRLQGGFVDVKVNEPKVVKGNEPKVVKGNEPKVVKGVKAVKSVMMRGAAKKSLSAKNILWSRNWHNLVTCTDIPASYYSAATERRHSASMMKKYFSKCGGIIWVRLNSGRNNDVATFIMHVIPLMSRPFILITTDGDNSVPTNIYGAQKLLDNALCQMWYTQNYDGSVKHPKLKPVPIGFDLHTNWKGLWSYNVSKNLKNMLKLRKESLSVTRDTVPFVPPWGMSHNDRIHADRALECLHHKHGERMGIDKLWETYGSKMFALSPRGNGLDCHRTWELLFFGVVPIIKSSGLDILYDGLPVVIVNDWSDVCEVDFFVKQQAFIKDKWPMSLDKFQLKHWISEAPPTYAPANVNILDLNVDESACTRVRRIGDTGDGGWWTCDDFNEKCVVYSFGIRDNYSFDKELRTCDVHGFDPSIYGLRSKRLYESLPATYHSYGLGGEDRLYGQGKVPFEWPGIDYLRDTNSDPWQLYTIPTIMKKLGHSTIDILKVDVEGSEWASLPSILESDWSQLLIELHFPPDMFILTKTTSGVKIRLQRRSSRTPPRLSLIRKLTSIATLWRLDFNGNHCLEMSWKRKLNAVKRPTVKYRKYNDRANYNFNDIITGYDMKHFNEFPTVSGWTCDEILCEYFRNWRQKWNAKFQNYTFDKYLLQRVVKTHIDTYSYELPSGDDIVMHIRLGDVSRSACFDHEAKCRTDSRKFPYQFTGKCYKELIQILPKKLSHVVLVSSDKWNTNKQHESVSYKEKLIRLLEENGYSVTNKMDQYMDSDIAFMSHAKYFIGGGGGFSNTMKEQAILNNATVFDAWYPRVQGQKCIWNVHKHTRNPKKLDIFHMNHEKAVWRMRFEEHWDFVDEFHVFESSISHQGNPKILYFKENQHEFKKYASKIVYHEISSDFNREPCKNTGNWICENHDRIEIAKIMNNIIDDDDIVIFSDADEIIFSDVLAKLEETPSLLPTRIRTPIYKYSFHWKQQQNDRLKQCIVARGAYVKQYTEWNALRRENDITAVIEHGGLSPSTFGSIDEIIIKSLHSRTKRILARNEVIRRVNNGISLWDNNKRFVYKESIPFLPRLARTDPGYFKEHFMRYSKKLIPDTT